MTVSFYALRRSATQRPEHPRSENCQVPLPCRSKSCPSALVGCEEPPLACMADLAVTDEHFNLVLPARSLFNLKRHRPESIIGCSSLRRRVRPGPSERAQGSAGVGYEPPPPPLPGERRRLAEEPVARERSQASPPTAPPIIAPAAAALPRSPTLRMMYEPNSRD